MKKNLIISAMLAGLLAFGLVVAGCDTGGGGGSGGGGTIDTPAESMTISGTSGSNSITIGIGHTVANAEKVKSAYIPQSPDQYVVRINNDKIISKGTVTGMTAGFTSGTASFSNGGTPFTIAGGTHQVGGSGSIKVMQNQAAAGVNLNQTIPIDSITSVDFSGATAGSGISGTLNVTNWPPANYEVYVEAVGLHGAPRGNVNRSNGSFSITVSSSDLQGTPNGTYSTAGSLVCESPAGEKYWFDVPLPNQITVSNGAITGGNVQGNIPGTFNLATVPVTGSLTLNFSNIPSTETPVSALIFISGSGVCSFDLQPNTSPQNFSLLFPVVNGGNYGTLFVRVRTDAGHTYDYRSGGSKGSATSSPPTTISSGSIINLGTVTVAL